MITSSESPNENRSWEVTTEPVTEPITADDLKTFARIDGDDENSLLETIIEAVRESMEFYLGRSLMEQTITLTMDFWPDRVIELPKPPLLSVVSVYVLDEEDTQTEYAASNYYRVTEAIPGLVCLTQEATGPTNTDRDKAGFAIKYLAGYGSLITDVPAGIRVAMMQWATMVYDGRAMTTTPPPEVKQNLDLYRVIKL